MAHISNGSDINIQRGACASPNRPDGVVRSFAKTAGHALMEAAGTHVVLKQAAVHRNGGQLSRGVDQPETGRAL